MRIRCKAWTGKSGRKVGTTEGMKQIAIDAESEREAAILSMAMSNVRFDAIYLFAHIVWGIKSGCIPSDREAVITSILDAAEAETAAEVDRRTNAMEGKVNNNGKR